MIAGKWFDPCVGVDIHIVLVPTPGGPVPTPLPHPFVGLIYDPVGLIVGAAIGGAIAAATSSAFKGPVLVNSLPAAHTGIQTTNKMTMPHIPTPPGTAWAGQPPANDGIIVTGSKTVYFSGTNAVRLGDLVMTCGEPIRVPSSTIIAIPVGLPVLVGGPPTLDVMAALFAMIRTQWVSEKLHDLLGAAEGSWTSKVICFLTGHPVDVVSGMVLTDHVDFRLPGPIPFEFSRQYYSRSEYMGPLGFGWSHAFDQAIRVERRRIVLRGPDGRDLYFRPISVRETTRNQTERMDLTRTGDGYYVTTHDNRRLHFGNVGRPNRSLPLLRIEGERGNALRLNYDRAGLLTEIVDSAGRTLAFKNDAQGRLIAVSIPDPRVSGQRFDAVRFDYDQNGDLSAAYDALGQAYRYRYKKHLLVQETDPAGVSFYFIYDGSDSAARCVRTWGDGGIYDHVLTYDPKKRVTVVEDSLGNKTSYFASPAGLVEKIIDPLGGETKLKWDKYSRKTLECDRHGRTTVRKYDDRGNLTEIAGADGSKSSFDYDQQNHLTRATDPNGNQWLQSWDSRGLLRRRVSPKGREWTYSYDERGLRTAIRAPSGARVEYQRNGRGEVVGLSDATGLVARLDRDLLGRVTALVDAMGNRTVYQYDRKSRLLKTTHPSGREESCAYDEQGNVSLFRDGNGGTTRIRCQGNRALAERVQADGSTLRYQYDTEERLVGVVNERGERYELVRDPLGRIIKEIDYWGNARCYEYDPSGKSVRITDALGRPTVLDLDPLGRVTKRLGHDGKMETFSFDANGNLIAAENDVAMLERVFDEENRLVRESQNGFQISNEYDSNGNRVTRRSPYGNAVRFVLDQRDNLSEVRVNEKPLIQVMRDPRGYTTEERITPSVGRRMDHNPDGFLGREEVYKGTRTVSQRLYLYDKAGQLVEWEDPPRNNVARMSHDALGRVTGFVNRKGVRETYEYDPAGNLLQFLSRQGSQPSGWSALCNGVPYRFDACGNLVERGADGARQVFEWDGHNRLARITRQDGLETRMAFDPLGRRVFKESNGVKTWFRWDGDQLLSEETAGETKEYLFYPRSFKPLAVLGRKGNAFFFQTDPVGLPHTLHDADGRIAWSAEYNGLGNTTQIEPVGAQCPFRLQGQYYDPEIELAYNRFRFFHPASCRFISQDPLRLGAGENLYEYAPNVWRWIDPFGLACDIHGVAPDYATKGVHMSASNDIELSAVPGMDASIIFKPVFSGEPPSAVTAAIREAEEDLAEDPRFRAKLLDIAEKATTYLAQNGAAPKSGETRFLAVAVRKLMESLGD
jgi:RHS repeat-associated protein